MVTTAIVGHVLLLSVVARRRVMPGPGACWLPGPSRENPSRDRRHPGTTANWVVVCRHAKSARSSELRLGVYTLDRGAFSTPVPPSTAWRSGPDFAHISTLNWEYSLAGIADCRRPGLRAQLPGP